MEKKVFINVQQYFNSLSSSICVKKIKYKNIKNYKKLCLCINASCLENKKKNDRTDNASNRLKQPA